MSEVNRNIDILGALVVIIFYTSAILVFIFRLMGKPQIEYWIGIFEFCLVIPMIYLLIKAPELNRHVLYYIQVVLIIIWLGIELLLDYMFKIDFRHIQWLAISYVTLFFAATGGMIGIASYAGREWSIISIFLFFVMTVLAFVQRKVTGM